MTTPAAGVTSNQYKNIWRVVFWPKPLLLLLLVLNSEYWLLINGYDGGPISANAEPFALSFVVRLMKDNAAAG
jgi:hypothetical protein